MSDLALLTDSCRALLLSGRPDDARRLALDGLGRFSEATRLRHLYAVACLTLGMWAEAEPALRRVVESEPSNAQAWDHLGVALHHQRRHPEAADAFACSLSSAVGVATTWANAASNAFDGGRYGEALRCAGRALELDPGLSLALLSKGNALLALGRPLEAAACLESALEQPGAGLAERSTLALAWAECGRTDEAAHALDDILRLDPDALDARLHLAYIHYRAGRLRASLEHYRTALQRDPDNAAAWSAYLFALTHSDEVPREEVMAEHLRFGRHFDRPDALARRHDHLGKDPGRALRIGFVSGDLRDHPVARFIAPVWDTLREAGCEIRAYHSAPIEDAVSDRLRALTDGWRNVHAMDDGRLAERIERDAIDILFDLSGHTAYNRLPVFARRPAPIQISWIGYPATTGLRAIDHRFTTPLVATDPSVADAFSEGLIALSPCNRFKPLDPLPAVTPLPCLASGCFTFASFARPAKISASTVALWGRVLRLVPGARMLIGGVDDGFSRDRIDALFDAQGIARARIEYRGRVPLADYLAAHREVDLLLDTLPYSGGTTVNYGLWMGVPTLTLAPRGAQLSQRHSTGALLGAGLAAWVAASEAAYVARAVEAATVVEPLRVLRGELRARMQSAQQQRHKEDELPAVLRRLWRNWCAAGQAAAPSD